VATLVGWGGPQLLASYERERRSIGLRNVKASGAAMSGRLSWRAAYHPDIRKNTPDGAGIRAEIASRFDVEQRKVTEILGIEAGYRYVDSPLIWPEADAGPDPDNVAYVPTTWPGARVPHVWLNDGTALHDRLGPGYTLLRLGGSQSDVSGLRHAWRKAGAPLVVLDFQDAKLREIAGFDLLLLRPDLHVAWRGNQPMDDPGSIAAVATGRAHQRVKVPHDAN